MTRGITWQVETWPALRHHNFRLRALRCEHRTKPFPLSTGQRLGCGGGSEAFPGAGPSFCLFGTTLLPCFRAGRGRGRRHRLRLLPGPSPRNIILLRRHPHNTHLRHATRRTRHLPGDLASLRLLFFCRWPLAAPTTPRYHLDTPLFSDFLLRTILHQQRRCGKRGLGAAAGRGVFDGLAGWEVLGRWGWENVISMDLLGLSPPLPVYYDSSSVIYCFGHGDGGGDGWGVVGFSRRGEREGACTFDDSG